MSSIIQQNEIGSRLCVVCDLDGTLANCEHRQHHVRGEGKKNWKAFFDGMYADTLNEPLNLVLQQLWCNYDLWFVSARPDNYREVTEDWLFDKAGWRVSGEGVKLIMRKAGDYRADTIVKEEILAEIRAQGFEPLIVFDDRKSVVDMWRQNGVLCAQVADHDF